MFIRKIVLLLLLFVIIRCNQEDNGSQRINPLFTLLDNTSIGIDFENKVVDQENFNVLTYRNYYNGGGVAIGDINNDGLADIFLTANMGPNQLYLNKGDLKFENISSSAGIEGRMKWSTGVTMADVNGDGFLDIYICNSGDVDGSLKQNELYINNGDLSFTEAAQSYGVDDKGFSTHASFFDMDGDGDLDMYLLNNSFKDPSRIDFSNVRNQRDEEGGDKLFRNDGDKFVDVSAQSGIYSSKIGFGLGVSVSDVNGDNLPDIYISNDFWERDYLYLNEGGGIFKEVLTDRIPLTSTASMGADIADLDNNGTYDIISTDMLPATSKRLKTTTIFNDYKLEDLKYRNDYHFQVTQNCLQINDGEGYFSEIAQQAGVSATDWSWAALIFDFDNDGYKDIFVSNGVYHDITDMDFSDFLEDREEVKKIVEKKGRFDFRDFLGLLPSSPLQNYAFVNDGQLNFTNKAEELGLGTKSFSNGSAYGDLDNDGDLDLVVNNVNMPVFVYENHTNETQENSYVRVKFSGDSQNLFGIGACVSVVTDEGQYYAQNYQARGFQSSTEPILTIGLGKSQAIKSLEVTWPSGRIQIIDNPPINAEIMLQETSATIDFSDIQGPDTKPLLKHLELPIVVTHRENLYNDFDYESLSLHMLSTEGPQLQVDDLNGDHLDDMVLLGAADDPDKVIIQNKAGQWSLSNQSLFDTESKYESTCGLLYDLDNDGDMDLLIGTGGHEMDRDIDYFKLRSYLNNGKGQFSINESIVLPVAGNLSCIVPINLGNQRALFFGARSVPGNFGLPPRNFLLLEQSPGFWRDITNQEIGQLGMVTDAAAADMDGDGDEDLIIVGEWMSVLIFENDGSRLQLKGSVPNSSGFWQSVTASDLDKDGDIDFILGNWGTNSKLKASVDKPLTMYVNDFDNNKKAENILLWYAPEDDEPALFAAKRDLTGQLPSLKKKILKNRDYSEAKFEDLFDATIIEKSIKLQVTELRSSMLINQGNLRFDLKALPPEAQRSVIFASAVCDIDEDGINDIVVGGNLYGLKPEMGRLDSSNGLVLKGDKRGSYSALSKTQSGLFSKGEIRDIKVVNTAREKQLIVIARNNKELDFYIKNE